MISESLREVLYPLGFVATFFFTVRFAIQWLYSEYKGQSLVPRSFWITSLIANILLCMHGGLQFQYHVAVIQGCNGVLSWRNLNLMQQREKQIAFSTVVAMLITVALAVTCYFWLTDDQSSWFRVPATPWQHAPEQVSMAWHLFGFTGMLIFASRFWIQWYQAEKHMKSFLGNTFWWMSIVSCLIILTYCLSIGDIVNAIGPGFGMIPYVRNLMLLRAKPS